MTADIRDEAERKQVTVLFADVSGSMDLAEGQDPEDWRRIMQRFFALLTAAVERYEGTVDKFTGDGVMAVFGAPVAHEDHARRACFAALLMLDDVAAYAAELRREQGLNFSIRIGINSGDVVAGGIGPGGEGAYTAIGHTVGLAQRMEALAEPGKAYLTERTAELAHGYLDLTDLGEFEIKGASAPLRVHELAGVGPARSRLDLAAERGFSRFVGRDAELGTLAAALRHAQAGEGAAVGIVAGPGTGKSRLFYEFLRRHAGGEDTEVFEAQAQPHATGSPFMPLLQMLRAFFAIDAADPAQLARERIAGRALLLDPAFADDLPLVFDFLGVPDPARPAPRMSPEARQAAFGDFLCRLAGHPRRDKALVLVVEDLHWIDPGSDAILAQLVEALEGSGILLLVNFRPEYEPPFAASTSYRTIALEPLGREQTSELVADLAGADPSLDGLADPIHERTAGNPFFIEEIVRELAEAGFLSGERGAYRLVRPVEGAAVPATVQAVLAARIDRLGPEAKRLLQVGSVVGRELGVEALALTAGLEAEEIEPPLAELIAAGFLDEIELRPRRVLAFRHPLTREVAYGTQLVEQREATHAAAARATIALEPERHDELAALIADHLRRGGETLEAARWSARAAHWVGSSRPREALRLWRTVMELADQLDEDEETAALAVASRLLQLQLSWRVGMDAAEHDRLAAEAEEIATRREDLRSLAMLKMATAARPGLPHRAETWIAAVEETNRLAERSGDLHLQVALRAGGAYAYLCTGDLEGFEAELDAALELAGGDRTIGAGIVIGSPLAWAVMGKAMMRREAGDLDEAERLLDRALEIATEDDDPETASWIRSNQAGLAAMMGDPEAALAIARRNCELTNRIGDVFSRSLALVNLAWAQNAVEDHAGALESIEAAERLFREAMPTGGEMEAWRGTLRAEALREVGRVDEAVAVARQSVELATRTGMRWNLPLAHLVLARALRAAGEEGVAEEVAAAERFAREIGSAATLAEIEAERAELVGAG